MSPTKNKNDFLGTRSIKSVTFSKHSIMLIWCSLSLYFGEYHDNFVQHSLNFFRFLYWKFKRTVFIWDRNIWKIIHLDCHFWSIYYKTDISIKFKKINMSTTEDKTDLLGPRRIKRHWWQVQQQIKYIILITVALQDKPALKGVHNEACVKANRWPAKWDNLR